jgi:hypothetical protein
VREHERRVCNADLLDRHTALHRVCVLQRPSVSTSSYYGAATEAQRHAQRGWCTGGRRAGCRGSLHLCDRRAQVEHALDENQRCRRAAVRLLPKTDRPTPPARPLNSSQRVAAQRVSHTPHVAPLVSARVLATAHATCTSYCATAGAQGWAHSHAELPTSGGVGFGSALGAARSRSMSCHALVSTLQVPCLQYPVSTL